MCGIAGILNFDGRPVDKSVLKAMTDVIAHRGPDSEGHWSEGSVGLGHRRLSIIDLSPEADQPMFSQTGNEVIVFNGEIYNYRELARDLEGEGMPCRTHSDTEVILNLYRCYGTECLKYLRGMFAFVIWDRVRQHLFVVRDRVGIKPLYYLLSGKSFVFGSEIKAIAVSGCSELRVDLDAFSGLLRFLVVPQPESIFRDIKKLEPGHYMLITRGGKVTEKVYWNPPLPGGAEDSRTESACILELDEVLRTSVGHHMVADVPVGAFLSGGLDSSAVVSLMREQAPDQEINAFSTIFPGEDEFNEDKYAREVARLKGINFHTDVFDSGFVDDIDRIAWHLDEPFAVSSAYATYYLARNAARHTKVVLTGDGGDELFAGYEGYKNDAYIRNALFSGFFTVAYHIYFVLYRTTGVSGSWADRILTGLRRRSGSEGLRYSEQATQNGLLASSTALNRDVLVRCLDAWERNLKSRYYDQVQSDDRLTKVLFADFKTRLVDEMLMKVDRMTMANSLEARVPLLDHEVVEFAFRLPSGMKLKNDDKGRVTKYLLKKNMEKYLSRDIIYRRKQGFNIPIRSWLEGDMLDSVRERLMGGMLQRWGIVDRDGLERLISLQADSTHHYNNMLMLLLAFESWANAYETRIGGLSVG